MASVFLLILYFLLKAGFNVVLVLLNRVFSSPRRPQSQPSCSAPFLLNMKPNLDTTSYTVRIPKFLRPLLDGLESFELPPSQLLSMILSFIFALCWFTNRKGAWMWLLQDVLSMSVCLLFVRTLRLPSLRIETVFLGLMFGYDVFMVLPHDTAAASAGSSSHLNHARRGDRWEATAHNSGGVCIRTESESMPMLMSVPRVAAHPTSRVLLPPPIPDLLPSPPPPTWWGEPEVGSLLWRLSGVCAADKQSSTITTPPPPPLTPPLQQHHTTTHSLTHASPLPFLSPSLSGVHGSYSLLGLGDIVLPALALAYARRVDLAGRGPPRSSHHLPRHNGGGSRGSPCCSLRSLLHLPLSAFYLLRRRLLSVGRQRLRARPCHHTSGKCLRVDIQRRARAARPTLLGASPGPQLLRAAICGEVAAVWTGHVLMVGEGGGQGDERWRCGCREPRHRGAAARRREQVLL